MSTTVTMFGSPPNKEIKRKVSSQKQLPKGILYPLAKYQNKRIVEPIKGVTSVPIFSMATGKDLITGMLRQLFLTRQGERVMLPKYGLNLDKYLFNPLDLTLFEQMKEDILFCISKYAGFLEVLDLSIFETSPYASTNGLMVYLNVKIKDDDLIAPFEVGVNIS